MPIFALSIILTVVAIVLLVAAVVCVWLVYWVNDHPAQEVSEKSNDEEQAILPVKGSLELKVKNLMCALQFVRDLWIRDLDSKNSPSFSLDQSRLDQKIGEINELLQDVHLLKNIDEKKEQLRVLVLDGFCSSLKSNHKSHVISVLNILNYALDQYVCNETCLTTKL